MSLQSVPSLLDCPITIREAWALVFSSVQWGERIEPVLGLTVLLREISEVILVKHFGIFLTYNTSTYVLDKLIIKIKMKHLYMTLQEN